MSFGLPSSFKATFRHSGKISVALKSDLHLELFSEAFDRQFNLINATLTHGLHFNQHYHQTQPGIFFAMGTEQTIAFEA